jgi:predicted regulator of Ras-like GTPase activity (Roadblock/LC7/MglB family)
VKKKSLSSSDGLLVATAFVRANLLVCVGTVSAEAESAGERHADEAGHEGELPGFKEITIVALGTIELILILVHIDGDGWSLRLHHLRLHHHLWLHHHHWLLDHHRLHVHLGLLFYLKL